MRNLDLEFDQYLDKIQSILIHKYQLSKSSAYEKLREYEFLSDLFKSDNNHFFYHSPEYWADYLMKC